MMKCTYSGVIEPKQYIPCQNSRTKGTFLGCLLAPKNDLYRLKLYYLSYALVTSTPPKIPLLGAVFFGACKTPLQKFINFSQVYAPAHWFMSAVSNMVQIIAACIQMAALYWWQKNMYNMFWRRLEETLGRFPGNFLWECLGQPGWVGTRKTFLHSAFKIIVQCQHIAVNSICLALFF